MYTAEIYKQDGRTRAGERLVLKEDYNTDNLSMLEHSIKHAWRKSDGYRYEIHETWVTRVNSHTGREYRERYDTPRSCSPASDLYWSM
jgi:hypothetical protein